MTPRLVSDNNTQSVREERVRVAFAAMATMLLRHLAGGDCLDNDPLREYLAVHDAMEAESEDQKGIAVKMPSMQEESDKVINTILCGSLRMVAGLLESGVGREFNEAYEAGQTELIDGIKMFNLAVGVPRSEDFAEAVRMIGAWAMPGGKERPTKDELLRVLFLLNPPGVGRQRKRSAAK